MKTSGFIKTSIAACMVFVGVVSFSPRANAWGWAAHAYVTGHFTNKDVANAVYGSVAPDAFQYAFDNPCFFGTLHDKTHHDFMPLWINASTMDGIPVKAAAFGFVSHNDTWGEDLTAHHDGITSGQGEGYVIAKAEQLKAILQQVPEFQALGVPDPVALEMAHELVEDGVDILMKRVEPEIGRKLMSAAMGRTNRFPVLFAETYASDLAWCAGISEDQARTALITAESQFRNNLVAYGVLLAQDEPTAIRLMSEQVAALAGDFLAANGITLPEGTDLVPLAGFGITTAMGLCEGDFVAELDATTTSVGGSLAVNGVLY